MEKLMCVEKGCLTLGFNVFFCYQCTAVFEYYVNQK